jgi:hypothetical protein
MAAWLLHWLQTHGWLDPVSYRWFTTAWRWVYTDGHIPLPKKPGIWFTYIQWWSWPLLGGLLAHLFFGPKQTRPIYLKYPRTLYSYGGIKVDHNAGCRGGIILGKTGAGKTQNCINPRNHSMLINNAGVEHKSWASSETKRQFDSLRTEFLDTYSKVESEISKLAAERQSLQNKIKPIQDHIVSSLIASVRSYGKENLHTSFSQPVFDGMPEHLKLRFMEESHTISPLEILSLFDWARRAQRFNDLSSMPMVSGALGSKINEYADLIVEDSSYDAEISRLYYLQQIKRADLQRFADTIKALRFEFPPIGMLVLGAKGNEWQNVVPMLHHYQRDEDLCLLQTRPVGAPPDWQPPAKFNLIGYDAFPSDTYAKLLCDASAAVTGQTEQDFFTTQARDAIGNGITLLRAIRNAQVIKNIPKVKRLVPNLATLARILTALPVYNTWMTEIGAAPKEVEDTEVVIDPKTGERTLNRVKKKLPPTLASDELRMAREKIEKTYWGLPDETRGGVMGNIRNVISPFTEPEVAQVFCEESTFDISELCNGKVICIAMPQIFAVQRMYVATIMKTLTFQIGLNIFDLRKDNPLYSNRNTVLIDSDEHQVSAGQEDQQVDRTREAQFTLYAATQSRSALYMRYGGKEKAIPVLSNLANGFICQSGNDDCAEESVKLIGEATQPETTHSKGGGSTSYKEKPFFTKGALKMLPPFHVIFVPAEGKFIFKLLISMPVTPDGKTPPWWFGSWNLWHWFACSIHLPVKIKIWRLKIPVRPKSIIYPWAGKAPVKAQIRYLLGLDGTFICLKYLTRKKALKMALTDHH